MPFKLGRRPRAFDNRIPSFTWLTREKALPPPPDAVDWTKTLPVDLHMFQNDSIGDCVEAAYYHALQVWSENAKPPIWTVPDLDVVKLYELSSGYNPNDPNTDQGSVLQTVLAYLVKNGAPVGQQAQHRHKLAAYVEIDVSRLDDIRRVIAECGVCYIGFNVPAYLMNSGPPQVWDLNPAGDNTIIGGHCVALAGYQAEGLHLISWGQTYRMTWPFFAHFCDEAYAMIDPDWVEKRGTTPGGLSLAELEAAMQAIKEGG